MGKVPTQARVPTSLRSDAEKAIAKAVTDIAREFGVQINLGAEGRISSYVSATDTKPTHAGAPGDFAPNNQITRLGTIPAQYVILGWRCTGGTTWEQITELVD